MNSFYFSIPKKNIWSYLLLLFPVCCIIPIIKKVIFLSALKNCKYCRFEPGFRFYYGYNVTAEQVSFSNAFLMDYDVISIGKGSAFSKDCIVITGEHDVKNRNVINTRPVIIGKNVWIATRSIILPGVTIGDNSVIGAGSVVTRSIPPNCIAAGNPARVIRKIE